MEVRNGNTRIVAALSPDNLGTGERVDPSESGAAGEVRINPTGLQRAEVRGSEVVANAARPTVLWKADRRDQPRRAVPRLQLLVVDTAVARIHPHLLRVERGQTLNRFGSGCLTRILSNASVELWTVMGRGVGWR